MLLINPDSRIYRDIPNISLGYCAAELGARVVDLNAVPEDPERYLAAGEDEVGISWRSNTEAAARDIRDRYLRARPRARVTSIRNCVDVLCCYPYRDWPGGISIQPEFGDRLPFPAYERFDSFAAFRERWQSGAWPYYILTSLGCPFGCTYCAGRRRRWRTRSVGNCFEELKRARAAWGIRRFDVVDDCFNVDKTRVLEFCERAACFGVPWTCANGLRADLFDEDVARALRKAGCRYISFGVESLDDGVLARIQKGEDAAQIRRAVEIATRHFPGRVNCFLVLGLPGSTYESDLAGLRWAIRSGVSANFSFFVEHAAGAGDAAFNGEPARPTSDAYDPVLQQKIYDYTNYMRANRNARFKTLRNVVNTLRLILAFDPWRLPVHAARYARILWSRTP